MDAQIMKYYKLTTDWCKDANLAVSPALAKPLVGLVFPEGSTLRSQVNAEILTFLSSSESSSLNDAYFPDGNDDTLQSLNLALVLPAAGIIILYSLMQIFFVCIKCNKRRNEVPKTGASVGSAYADSHSATGTDVETREL